MSEQIERPAPSLSARLPNLFFALAILFGLIFIFLEPPFVCPDEPAHYLNVCRISHGHVFADVADGTLGCIITEEERDLLLTYEKHYNDNSFSYSQMSEFLKRESSDTLVFTGASHATINPTPYLIAALGIAACRLFSGGLSAYLLILVGKTFNLLFYAAVIRHALRKTAVFQKTMFLFALMPMALFQGASLSYDAILIPASFLLFAYVTKLLLAPDEYTVSRGDIVGICFACAFLLGSKIAYGPLILLLFAIRAKHFGSRKKWWLCVGAVAATGILFYLIPTLVNTVITRDVLAPPPTEAALAQSAYFSENFWRFPVILVKTALHYGIFWKDSFIGILGWLDTVFPLPYMHLFTLVLLFTALTDMCRTKGVRPLARVLALVGVLLFYAGTVYIMYIEWNPVIDLDIGGDIAHGVQGRYFIPVALSVMLAGANDLLGKLRCKEKMEELRDKLVGFTAIAFGTLSALLLLVRYWTV